MDGGDGGNAHRRASQWEMVTVMAAQWTSGGSSTITMCGIEIAVDGGGSDGQWWHNVRQDVRAAGAGQGE